MAWRTGGEVLIGPPDLTHTAVRLEPDGAIAQLGERLLCTQEVAGSIPAGSIAASLVTGGL